MKGTPVPLSNAGVGGSCLEFDGTGRDATGRGRKRGKMNGPSRIMTPNRPREGRAFSLPTQTSKICGEVSKAQQGAQIPHRLLCGRAG